MTELVAGRYALLRELGRGGMATVYLAVDRKHGREVALKVLRPELATLGPERFLHEIEITAGLNHPHILPLLDSGYDAGVLYYAMPYAAGGSLRLLLSTGPVPLEAATRIVGEVAAALDYAHGHGVIHRDVKPENILFIEGLAVVADFGIAHALSDAAAPLSTGTARWLGTPGYMSPEQALAARDLDARTDVYSLGCVAYEMLVGATPAAWPGGEEVELGRFAELPPEHREALDRLPGRVEQVLTRALALRPQHRYARAGELAASLAAAAERTRAFSDEQVRQLLRRAVDLQAAAPPPDTAGLTVGAVEQIAAQVGIPPVHVRQAARELAPPQPAPAAPVRLSAQPDAAPPPLLRDEWIRVRERWNRLAATEIIEGDVPQHAYPAMVAEIERRLQIPGHASILGSTLTWSPAAQSASTRRVVIQVAPANGRTTIHIREDLELHGLRRAVLPLGTLLGTAFALALSQVPAMGEVMPLLVLGGAGTGAFLALRAMIWGDAEDRAPGLLHLARALASLARDAVAQQDTTPQHTSPSP